MMPEPQQLPKEPAQLSKLILKTFYSRAELWKPGEWAYFSNLPGTVQIKEVHFPYYVKALYLVEFQDNHYWAFHHELEDR